MCTKKYLVYILVSLLLLGSVFTINLMVPRSSDESSNGNDQLVPVDVRGQGYPAAIKGYVTYASTGDPIQGVYVGADGDSPDPIYTLTDVTGYYCLNLTDGEWTVQVNKSGYSGYGSQIALGQDQVMTLDVGLHTDSAPPVINYFDISLKEYVSTHKPTLIKLSYTEHYAKMAEISFARIHAKEGSLLTLTPITSYTNSDDHPPMHSRELVLVPGENAGDYTATVDWNAASTGYKIYYEGGPSVGREYQDGAFIPADTRMGNGYAMLMGYYTKETYSSTFAGAIIVKDGKVMDFWYMGGGDQAQVDLEDPTAALQFAMFYYTMDENPTQGGPPQWGYLPISDPIPINNIVLKPWETAPSGDYILSTRVEDWGSAEDDFKYDRITVDTDTPFANSGGPYNAKQNEEIMFDGSGSADEESVIVNWTWKIAPPAGSLKETVYAYGEKPKVSLEEMGEYSILLKVKDSGHNTALDETSLVIKDGTEPEAVISLEQEIYAGDETSFDASDSHDNVEIVNYTWNFTDGDEVVLYGKNPGYTFNEIGKYRITLTVYDAEGQSNSVFGWINVVERPPSDTTPPSVIEEKLIPKNKATEVEIGVNIEIPFTEDIDPETLVLDMYYYSEGDKKVTVTGTSDYNKETYVVVYNIKEDLLYSTYYMVVLSVEDRYFNLLEDYSFTFTTKAEPVPPPDYDNDNIPDYEDDDIDNDQIPDIWELEYGLDPYDETDASQDTDGDGLSALQEYKYGSNPTDVDSDDDGIPDDWEIEHNMNASDPEDAKMDKDKDGYSNLNEYLSNTDPLDENDVPLSKSKASDKGYGSTYLILGIVAAVVVILLAYMLYFRNRKQDTDESVDDKEEENEQKDRVGRKK